MQDIIIKNDLDFSSNKIHVAILGTCCLRDIIGFSDQQGKYVVDRFVQSNNPISIIAQSPLLKGLDNVINSLGADNKRFANNFYRRNLSLDLEKKAIEYVSEANSEWLFIDMACLRISIINYANGMYTDMLAGLGAKNVADYLTKNGTELLSKDIPDEVLFFSLDKFIKKILNFYPQEKLIIFNIRAAKYCVLKDNTVSFFPEDERFVAVYKGYDYILSKLPNAHVVDFPVNVLGDETHKWGKANLHYVKEYYDYAYEAVNKITGGGYSSLNEERKDLSRLKSECERIINDKYNSYFVKTVSGYSLFRKSYENYVLAYYERSKWIYDGLSKIDFSVCEDLICEYLRQEIDLERYILALNLVKAEYLIVFAVKDTPGNTITENEVNYIRALGFSKFSKVFRMMYAGICYKNDVYCDIGGEKSLLPVTYNRKIDGVNVKVSSMAWSNGNKAEILINGIDYSVNMRGINIVVYDIKKDSVVDSVAFDYVMPSRTVKHLSFEYDNINNGFNNIYLRQNNKITDLQLELAYLYTESDKIKKSNQELINKLDEKQNEINKWIDEYNNLNTEINELKDNYFALDKKYLGLEETLTKNQQYLQQSLQQNKALKYQKDVVENELNDLTALFNSTEQEKAAINDTLLQTQKELEETTNNAENLAARLSDMEKSLSFRTGRAITYVPRKIRDLFKKK